MKRLTLIALLLISCSSADRRTPSLETTGPPMPLDSAEYGKYRKPLALVTYELVNRHLGHESRLAKDERTAFWETIRGLDVVWTGSIVEIGDPRELTIPVKLRVGRRSSDWDTLVFFDPEYYGKLKWYEPGDTISFRGSVEQYELTTTGVQVTVARGRFTKSEEETNL